MVETIDRASSDQPHAVFCGGFHSSMQGVKAKFLRNFCQQRGWGYTRFDYRGHGASDAEIEHCSLHDWLGDTLVVLDELEKNAVLIGSSMGAWLAVHATMQRPEKVSALLTIAAAPDFTERLLWAALSDKQKKQIGNNECVTMPTKYEGEDWRIRRGLFDSGRDLALLNNSNPLTLTVPIRMLHGTQDVDVPWTMSQQLLEKCTNSTDATLTLIRGADHRLSDELSLNEITAALERLVENKTGF